MSKQLALSAAFSTFAMAAFALAWGPQGMADAKTGTAGIPAAPVFEASAPELPAAPALLP